ncbi:hypothetical protein ASU31_00220 [Pedobacter ginsenosidimutans]|uniref:Uncharacterized protein n=1 Tax=Pedobacter ginsenosidimutans TaxID=687842 RepID=A0A0T5VV57_9SPHI|nr:hypothetical protein [Pedobacter ginsenosidimutans]KRT17758.1 hypothetical protein ASU31_00220 [Pedobacter ginsenosidimutans]
MKINTKVIYSFVIFVGVTYWSCTKKLQPEAKSGHQINKGWDRNQYFPTGIKSIKDSITSVSFFQTARPFYLEMKDSRSKKCLDMLQRARNEQSLVNIRLEGNSGKIVEVKFSAKQSNEIFRRSVNITRKK